MKISSLLKAVSHTRINLFVVIEEPVFVGNVYVIKLNLEKCMENTARKMTSLVPITMEIYALGTESVKQAAVSASVAGKGTGANAHHHQPSTVSTQGVKCVVGEGHVCVAGVSAPTPEA